MLSKRNITECVFANLVAKWWPCKKNNFNRENRLGRNEDVQVANLCTEKRLKFSFEWIGAMFDLGPKVVKILSIKEKQWLDSDTNPLFV